MPDRLTTVKRIISDLVENRFEVTNLDENLFHIPGGLTSVLGVQLMIRLEEEFGIEIPDEDLDLQLFCTPNRILAYLKQRLGEEGQQPSS